MLTLPFANGKFWIFAWFGFVPLLFVLEDKSKKQAFFFAYITGILFWLGVVYWLANVTVIGLILLVLYLALYFGIFGLVVSRSCLVLSPYYLILVPSLWVLLEYVRSYLLTGFPWALLGYSQYKNLTAIQIADISGVWGVSFLVMLGNVLIYKVIGDRPWVIGRDEKSFIRCSRFIVPLFLLISSFIYGFYKVNLPSRAYHLSSTLKVSVIQGNIPQELKWDPRAKPAIIDKYLKLTREVSRNNPGLIIWPEAASPCYLNQEEFCFNKIKHLSRQIGIPLLLGTVATEGEIYYNSALLVGGNGDFLCRYDKIHLVPFGEYVPLRNIFTFLDTVVPIGDFTAGREYTVFEIQNPLPCRQAGKSKIQNRFSVLICFEDVFPELSRRFVKKGADFLVNITNDAWFGCSSSPYQHLAASVLRAVENNVFVVRAANTGVSAFIDSRGRIVSLVQNQLGKDIFIEGFHTQSISSAQGVPTFYCRFGDIFIFLLSIYAIYSIFRLIKVKRSR